MRAENLGPPPLFLSQAARGSGICPAELVTCIVVDECHRVVGKTDMVLAIRKMARDNLKFRVIGLSATPGRDRGAIQVLDRCESTEKVEEMSSCVCVCGSCPPGKGGGVDEWTGVLNHWCSVMCS